MQSVKYLDLAIAKLNLKNDFALTKHFGWSSGAMSQYRSGKRVMDDEACLAVAMALELDEHQTMRLLMAAGMDRAEKAGQQSLWSVFSQRMAQATISAVIAGVTLFVTPDKANASNYNALSKVANVYDLYYVKLLLGKLRKLMLLWAKLTWNKRPFVPCAFKPTTR